MKEFKGSIWEMSSGGFLGTCDSSELHKVVSMLKVTYNWYIIFDKFAHFVFS